MSGSASDSRQLHKSLSWKQEFRADLGFTISIRPIRSRQDDSARLRCWIESSSRFRYRIAIGDRILFDAEHRTNLTVAKRRVGYVLQSLALFPHLTVEKNVQYGLADFPQAERTTRASSILQAFRIAHLAKRYPREISGGESQRTALARTLVTDPALLLLDEPLAALDAPTKAKIIDDLRQWNQAHRIPILYVTHSREESVCPRCERVIVLRRGAHRVPGHPA